ncbi:MAG TPA: fibronectin type III domain-containing protein [Gaiellaceae bacterium]|nr:fibronectin type III domain-containing protein [Gaiellaceae bacterium]
MTLGRRLAIGLFALAISAIAAASAAAATKPTAITGPVTATSSTSATVSGTVNPNGTATTWFFEYGKTTAYGSETTHTSAGAGTSDVAASATLSSLTPNTTYHYRLVATSSAGTSRGTDGIFTTSTAVEAVTSAATNVTLTSATLNGSVNPFGHATTWYFEYGTSTSYGTKTALQSAGSGTTSINVSADVTGLKAGKTYHYRLVAMNTAGTANGSDITFLTAAAPTATTASAASIGATSATVSGTVNPNGLATSWFFEYGTSTTYGSTTASKNAGSGTSNVSVSAPLSGLTAGTTYHYRLVAKSAAGTTRGADQSFATTGVTIHAAAVAVIYGNAVTLSGTVTSGQPGETVVIFSQPLGQGSFASVATLLTTAGGAWSYAAHPRILTQYEAGWKNATSSQVTVGVHPLVTLRALLRARFSVHVAAAHSFAGKYVRLQRLSSFGEWVSIGYARLNASSTYVFHPALPRGVSKLRATFSVNQAGAGYLGGTSRTISFRKR